MIEANINFDDEFTMSEQLLWLFPEMLENKVYKAKFINPVKVLQDKDGKTLENPMLRFQIVLDSPLESEDFPYNEFYVSFWSLVSGDQTKYKPSDILNNDWRIKAKGKKLEISMFAKEIKVK